MSQRATQSKKRAEDEDDIDLIMEQISLLKGNLMPITKKLFETNLNFNTPFDNETKATIKEHMIANLQLENELKLQQTATMRIQLEANSANQNTSVGDQPNIETMIEAADLDTKYAELLAKLKEDDTFNPMDDHMYTDLVRMLGDDNEGQAENEDLEMLETDFTIPIDPVSRMEIVIPVRNKVCDHVYDKDNFYKMFESLGRKSTIKCPFTGCTNKKVSINDVEEDHRLKLLIDNARQSREQ